MTAPEEQEPAVPTCTATGCTHPQAAGSTICALDSRRLGDWLAQLGAEYDRLTAEPSMQGREVGTIGGTTLAAQRNVGSMHVMALRDRRRGTGRIWADDADQWGLDDTPSVFSTLAGYAATVRDERKLVRAERRLPPVRVTLGGVGPVCDWWCAHDTCRAWTLRAVAPVLLTVKTERKLLADQLGWILGQEWAGEFFDAIHGLRNALGSSNGQGTAGRVHRLQTPCTSCGVRAVTHRPGDSDSCCENCGATADVERERISA